MTAVLDAAFAASGAILTPKPKISCDDDSRNVAAPAVLLKATILQEWTSTGL
jgi:hypothetical protein